MTDELRSVVAMGASAGGVEALRAVVGGLPADFQGSVLIVLHVPRHAPSALPAILSRSGILPARTAADGESLRAGHIYIAPSDLHMIVLGQHIRLTHGLTENGHRPAIDPLFRSVARSFGPRSIGVVLSGARDDGAAGLATIAAHGGCTIVQEPSDALYPWMPRAAIGQVTPDKLAPACEIGSIIAGLTARLALDRRPPEDDVRPDELTPADELMSAEELMSAGPAQIARSLAPTLALESALRMALRALEEKSALSRRMAGTQLERHATIGTRFQDMADEADQAGATIRRLIDWIGADAATPASAAPPVAYRRGAVASGLQAQSRKASDGPH